MLRYIKPAVGAFAIALMVAPAAMGQSKKKQRKALPPPPAAAAQTSLKSPFMRVYGSVNPPFGFVDFCVRHPDVCRSSEEYSDTRFTPTVEMMQEALKINRRINSKIAPVTDVEVYGVEEYWTYPVDKGDCEDYALLKQKVLMEKGWPQSSLLMTVVKDEEGLGHAVLTARTSMGDFILDNKDMEIKLWGITPYQYVARQSYLNPRFWISLDPASDMRFDVLGEQKSTDSKPTDAAPMPADGGADVEVMEFPDTGFGSMVVRRYRDDGR